MSVHHHAIVVGCALLVQSPQSSASAPHTGPPAPPPSPPQATVPSSPGLPSPPASTPAPPLKPLDQAVEDVGPLSSSLRDTRVDLRVPAGFQSVYRVPGRDDQLMRIEGALHAMFPRSAYMVGPSGVFPLIPAGTVFHIGPLAEMMSDPTALAPENAARLGRHVRFGFTPLFSDGTNGLVSLSAPRQSAHEGLQLGGRARYEPPDPAGLSPASVVNDAAYRQARLAQLMRAAAEAYKLRVSAPRADSAGLSAREAQQESAAFSAGEQ